MKIKTSELIDGPLDWAVELAEGIDVAPGNQRPYSTDPAHGHPIIEREGIGFFCNRTAEVGARFNPDAGADWRAFAYNKHGTHYFGPTSLIAAMRCYVASKLGDEVDVPEELLK